MIIMTTRHTTTMNICIAISFTFIFNTPLFSSLSRSRSRSRSLSFSLPSQHSLSSPSFFLFMNPISMDDVIVRTGCGVVVVGPEWKTIVENLWRRWLQDLTEDPLSRKSVSSPGGGGSSATAASAADQYGFEIQLLSSISEWTTSFFSSGGGRGLRQQHYRGGPQHPLQQQSSHYGTIS